MERKYGKAIKELRKNEETGKKRRLEEKLKRKERKIQAKITDGQQGKDKTNN